jgi:hypothetical protein
MGANAATAGVQERTSCVLSGVADRDDVVATDRAL